MASYTSTLTETLTTRDFFTKPWTQVSTNGSYITIKAEHATLTTALSEFINELEAQKCSFVQTQISVTFDTNNNKYAIVAVVKRH